MSRDLQRARIARLQQLQPDDFQRELAILLENIDDAEDEEGSAEVLLSDAREVIAKAGAAGDGQARYVTALLDLLILSNAGDTAARATLDEHLGPVQDDELDS